MHEKHENGILIHYENTPMKYTAILKTVKFEKFNRKNFDIFITFAQNIDYWYTLEPPCWYTLELLTEISDPEVLKKAGMQSMYTVLNLAQLRWTGHVIRMPDERLPKKVFYGELQEGKRSQGGQKKRYKDILKAALKHFHIKIGSWEQTAGAIKVARSHQQRSSSL